MDAVIKNTPQGFIKLPRGLLDSKTAGKPLALALFVRLLLLANREPKEWNGITVQRGQLATSLRSLADKSGLSVSQVRTALQFIQRDGLARLLTHPTARPQQAKVARSFARGYTVVTICNYDSYEGIPKTGCTPFCTPQNADTARPAARKLATTKEYKDIIINILGNDFLPIVEDWMAYKRERGDAYKGKKGLTQFCTRLSELSGGDASTARRLVSNAMAANWATVYGERPQAGSKSACRTRTPRALSIDAGDTYKTSF